MLKAIKTDKNNDTKKLWFNDHDHDLFIWLDQQGQPIQFQFSYRTYLKSYSEHVISWHISKGYSHDKIDDGEANNTDYKMTPILVPNGTFEANDIAKKFSAVSKEIDQALAQFVYGKICDCNI